MVSQVLILDMVWRTERLITKWDDFFCLFWNVAWFMGFLYLISWEKTLSSPFHLVNSTVIPHPWMPFELFVLISFAKKPSLDLLFLLQADVSDKDESIAAVFSGNDQYLASVPWAATARRTNNTPSLFFAKDISFTESAKRSSFEQEACVI